MKTISHNKIIETLRLPQLSKNIFIFLPLFFDKKISNLTVLSDTLIGFLAFSLMACSIYCFNDIVDRKNDMLHPVKKYRPIASGRLPLIQAIQVLAVGIIGALAMGFFMLPTSAFMLLLGYMILNVGYSLCLKKIAMIDLFVVAAFYVIRILFGCEIGDIEPSGWIIVMTYLLALFLILAKRRDDVLLLNEKGVNVRKGTESYNLEFINLSLTLIATVVVVAYIIYTMSASVVERYSCNYVYVTSVFVLAGIMRYMQISIIKGASGSPTHVFFNDRFIQLTVALWAFSFFCIIYLS